MATQFLRGSQTGQHATHSATYRIDGSYGGPVTIPLTNNRRVVYTTGVTDTDPDISIWFQDYAIQTTASNAKNVTIQASVDNSNWSTIPASACSSPSGVINPGDIVFVSLPVEGVRIRLLVDAPGAATDFTITVKMSNSPYRKRSA